MWRDRGGLPGAGAYICAAYICLLVQKGFVVLRSRRESDGQPQEVRAPPREVQGGCCQLELCCSVSRMLPAPSSRTFAEEKAGIGILAATSVLTDLQETPDCPAP